jgi:hypothetical protein
MPDPGEKLVRAFEAVLENIERADLPEPKKRELLNKVWLVIHTLRTAEGVADMAGGCSVVNNVDSQDTLGDIARDLPELGGRLGSMKEEALARLYSPEYDTLRLRLEVAHAAVEAAAVEARRRMRLSEGSEGE